MPCHARSASISAPLNRMHALVRSPPECEVRWDAWAGASQINRIACKSKWRIAACQRFNSVYLWRKEGNNTRSSHQVSWTAVAHGDRVVTLLQLTGGAAKRGSGRDNGWIKMEKSTSVWNHSWNCRDWAIQAGRQSCWLPLDLSLSMARLIFGAVASYGKGMLWRQMM